MQDNFFPSNLISLVRSFFFAFFPFPQLKTLVLLSLQAFDALIFLQAESLIETFAAFFAFLALHSAEIVNFLASNLTFLQRAKPLAAPFAVLGFFGGLTSRFSFVIFE